MRNARVFRNFVSLPTSVFGNIKREAGPALRGANGAAAPGPQKPGAPPRYSTLGIRTGLRWKKSLTASLSASASRASLGK